MSVIEITPRPVAPQAGKWPGGAVGLLLAVGTVVATRIVSEQAGFETIGQGGISQQLLPKVGDVAPNFGTQDVFVMQCGNRISGDGRSG